MNETTSETISLSVSSREVLGKSVKQLRKNGLLPANIYGRDYPSQAITVPALEFQRVYKQAGETKVVYITIEDQKEQVPCLIRLVQKHPVSDEMLHVDLLKINLKQKIETEVPLEYTGVSPAEKKGAVLIYNLDSITIEALPTDIPEHVTINLESVAEEGDLIKVSDLTVDGNYTFITEPETVIVQATAHREESVDPELTTNIPTEATDETAGEDGPSGSSE